MKKLHIDLKEGQQCWFTSDLHFGHRNVLRFCERPWNDVKDMGEDLIENFNNRVGEDDIVFILGDVFWFNESRVIKKHLKELKGKQIYIIPGNHDEFEHYYRVDDERIILCEDVVVCWFTKEGSKKITEVWMSHYPMMTWPHRERGAYQLYGHVHSNAFKFEGVDQDLPYHWNQIDVGVDYWNYEPVSLDEVLETFYNRKMVKK